MISDVVWLCDPLGAWSIVVPSGLTMKWDDCAICVLFPRDCKLDGSQPKLYISSSSGLGNLMGDLVFFGRLGMSTVPVDFIPGPAGVIGVPIGAIGFLLSTSWLPFAWRCSRYHVVYG